MSEQTVATQQEASVLRQFLETDYPTAVVQTWRDLGLTDYQIVVLTRRTPVELLEIRRIPGGGSAPYLPAEVVRRVLNEAFTPLGVKTRVIWQREPKMDEFDTPLASSQAVVLLRLYIWSTQLQRWVYRENFGGMTPLTTSSGKVCSSLSDCLMGAVSEATRKCGADLGIGLDLYGKTGAKHAAEVSREIQEEQARSAKAERQARKAARQAETDSPERQAAPPAPAAPINPFPAIIERVNAAQYQRESLAEFVQAILAQFDNGTKAAALAALDMFERCVSAGVMPEKWKDWLGRLSETKKAENFKAAQGVFEKALAAVAPPAPVTPPTSAAVWPENPALPQFGKVLAAALKDSTALPAIALTPAAAKHVAAMDVAQVADYLLAWDTQAPAAQRAAYSKELPQESVAVFVQDMLNGQYPDADTPDKRRTELLKLLSYMTSFVH